MTLMIAKFQVRSIYRDSLNRWYEVPLRHIRVIERAAATGRRRDCEMIVEAEEVAIAHESQRKGNSDE